MGPLKNYQELNDLEPPQAHGLMFLYHTDLVKYKFKLSECVRVCALVSVCECVMVLMNLSGLRAGGDVTADRLPAGMLRAPTV